MPREGNYFQQTADGLFQFIRRKWMLLLIPFLLNGLSGCKKEVVPKAFYARSDHEAYERSLEEVHLLSTALGKEWIEASKRSLQTPIDITLPYQEAFYFDSRIAEAVGYRFFVKRGLRIEIHISVQSSDSLRLFSDLFRHIDGTDPRYIHVATTDKDSLTIKFRPRVDAAYILRIQPELLRGGRFKVRIKEVPSLKFPVVGKNSKSIQSFFGDPRDGGKRDHHGVDIFAARHTPVIAPVRSQVIRIGEGRIGGRYVWLWEPKLSIYLYFAHLESQIASKSVWVNPGDTIGTVGNTGNARRTRPHLHFGVYINGPVDPWNFIVKTDTIPDPIVADKMAIGKRARLKEMSILRSGAESGSQSIDTLAKHSIMAITGATGRFYKIQLPDGLSGYILSDRTEFVTNEISMGQVNGTNNLLDRPGQDGVLITNLASNDHFSILGQFNGYYLIRTAQGLEGWMSISDDPLI